MNGDEPSLSDLNPIGVPSEPPLPLPPEPGARPAVKRQRRSFAERYNTRVGRIWAGILVSNAAAAFVGLLSPWLLEALSQMAGSDVSGAATFTLAIGLPMSVGLVAAYFWHDLERFEPAPLPPGSTWPPSGNGYLPSPPSAVRPREYESPASIPTPPQLSRRPRPTGGETALFTLTNSVMTLLPATLVLREGVICLVMAFPLLWLLNWTGTVLGFAIWRNLRRAQVSVVPLLLLLPALDMALAHAGIDRLYRGSVTTQVRVRARPAQIYRYLAAFPPIREPADDYWLWRVGAPAPRISRAEGAFVGARRECVLGQNTIIEERITRAEPGRALFFRVTKMPNDPEIMGHLYLFRGGFQIVPRSDGTCDLIGHTDYGLATRPGWYFDWWAQSVIHAVHRRVLNHIRQLAEHDAGASLERAHPKLAQLKAQS